MSYPSAKSWARLEFQGRVTERHEASAFAAVYVRLDEPGRSSGPLLLHYGKEGRVVEEQVLAHTQALTKTDSPFQIEVVRDIDRFNSIEAEWDSLVDRSGVDRLLLSHTWFRTWWEAFSKDERLHVITVRSGSRLVAAAPMMRMQTNIYGFRAESLHAIYNPHTPRCDFIVQNDQGPPVYEAVWRELVADTSCDVIVLAQIPEESRTIPAMEGVARRHGWLSGQWAAPASPFLSLGCDYETYFSSLRAGCRFNLTKRHARLMRLGPVDLETVTRRDDVEDAMRDGLRIEAAAWKGEKGTAMISDPSVVKFYAQLAQREADLGQLRLTFLRAAGKRIAFNYLLQNGKKLYAVKIGYDPQYHAYSPGNMLLNLILKDACRRGVAEYDLLGGDDEWKFDWTKETRTHRWLFLFRDRLWPRMLHQLKFRLVPTLKGFCRAVYERPVGRL